MNLKCGKKLLGFAVIIVFSFFMFACDKETTSVTQTQENEITSNNEATETTTAEVANVQKKLRQIYELAMSSESFSGTYEEWLETVQGPKGDDGRDITLQVADGYVQWQYVGDTTWNKILELSTLIGPAGANGTDGTDGTNGADGVDGRETIFQVDNGYVQWKYVGDSNWTNLLELSTIVDSSGTVTSEHSPVINGVQDTLYYIIGSNEFNVLKGVTAIDPKYGDITSSIDVNMNQANLFRTGTYDISYCVTNFDGYSTVVHANFVVTLHGEAPIIPDEFVIVYNEFYGLRSDTGEVLLEESFDNITYFGDRMLRCEKDGEMIFYDADNQTYIQYEYDVFGYFSNGLVKVRSEFTEASGYMNKSGEIVISCRFSNASSFMNERAIVEMRDNVGVIDVQGNEIIDIKYEFIDPLPNGYFLTVIDNEYVIKDNIGEDVLALSSGFFNGFVLNDGTFLFEVEIDGHHTIVNESFVELMPAHYNNIFQIENDFFYCDSIFGSVNIWNSTSRKNIFNVHDFSVIDDLFIIQVKEFVDVDAKYGIYDPKTETYLLEPEYKNIEPLSFGEGLFIATRSDDLKGIIDKNGTILTDFVIKDIHEYNAENFIVYEDSAGLLGTIGLGGTIAEAAAYSDIIDSVIDTRIVVNSEGLYGFIDEYGYQTISPQYFEANNFSEDLALVKTLDELFGWTYVSLNGTPITLKTYRGGSDFNNGLATIRVEDQNGEEAYKLISKTGIELTTVAYRVISPNVDGYSRVVDLPGSSYYGLLNEKGELIVPCTYTSIDYPTSDMIRVTNDAGLYGFYNIQGDLVIDLTLHLAFPFSNNLAIVENVNGHQGIIDNTGALIMDYAEVEMAYFTSSVVAYKEIGGDLYGLLNKYGTVICEPTYYSIGIFSNGLAPAKLTSSDDYGYINTHGEMVIKAVYSSALKFHENNPFAIVQDSFFYGLIDAEGKYVFEPIYSNIIETENGFMVVLDLGVYLEVEYKDGKLSYLIEGPNHVYYDVVYDDGWQVYDGETLVVDKGYSMFKYYEESGLWLVMKDGLIGLLDAEFNEIVVPQYDRIKISSKDEFLRVELNGNHGVLSNTGEVIVPAIYDIVNKQRNGHMFSVYIGDFVGLYSVEDGLIIPVEYLFLESINTLNTNGEEEIPS